MDNADDALKALGEIQQTFQDFCKLDGAVSEADTRAKVIDRIFKGGHGLARAADHS